MFKRICTYIFLLCPVAAFSQKTITGTVKNSKGEAQTVNVLIQSIATSAIEGFSSTDDKGKFSIAYKGQSDSIVVTITGMNIETQQKVVPANVGVVDFIAIEKHIQLKEASVIPHKIRRVGDTINYNVGLYLDQGDRVIGDVLKKLPGIEVKPSGSISYQGKDINKFYIENMDMLQGRYGIATNNIAAKDVATVQVLENHQPIRALQKTTYSDDAAINIKLKESAKGTLAMTALAGASYKPWGWQAELVSMYFAKNMQNMNTYKSNNVGVNLASEFSVHYDRDRLILNPNSLLSVQEPTTPPIRLKRYYDNNSHAATINYLTKLNDSLELVANVVYLYDYAKQEGYSLSEQYLPNDSVLWIEETANTKLKSHRIEAALKLNSNKSNYYLNNYFNLKGSFRDMRGYTNTISSNTSFNEHITQKLKDPSYGVDNTFEILKNIGKQTYNIYWATAYTQKPSDLTVTPANYWDLASLDLLNQDILSKKFATNIRTSYKTRMNYFELDYTLWARIDLENLETELIGQDRQGNLILTDDSLKNDLRYNTYQIGLAQKYSYKKRKLNMSLSTPIYYYILDSKDHILGRSNNCDKIIISPSLNVNYDLTMELKLGLSGNYSKSFGDINSSYSGYIMHNYRNFLRNTVDKLLEQESLGANMHISYSNALNALFINLRGGYNRSSLNLLYGYDYRGIMSVKTTIDKPTKSDGYSLNMSISKGFDFWSSIIRLELNHYKSRNKVLVQDKILDSHYRGYGFSTNMGIKPTSFIGLSYSLSWNERYNFVERSPNSFPKIRNVSQNGVLSVYPTNQLNLSFNIEHQYNSAASNRYSTFADARVVFKYKSIDYELEYSNIFNTQKYISTIYNSINIYYYNYNLRPAALLLKLRFKIN